MRRKGFGFKQDRATTDNYCQGARLLPIQSLESNRELRTFCNRIKLKRVFRGYDRP